jgi:hypothetical protein
MSMKTNTTFKTARNAAFGKMFTALEYNVPFFFLFMTYRGLRGNLHLPCRNISPCYVNEELRLSKCQWGSVRYRHVEMCAKLCGSNKHRLRASLNRVTSDGHNIVRAGLPTEKNSGKRRKMRRKHFIILVARVNVLVRGVLKINRTEIIKFLIHHLMHVTTCTRVYPKVSGLAAWSENCKWYSSLPLGAVVSLFCESV